MLQLIESDTFWSATRHNFLLEDYSILQLIESDTFWSAVSAIATVVGAAAIVFAAKQLRFDAWLKAQEIWVSPEFTEARRMVFSRLDDLTRPWPADEKKIGLDVCRRVDEFVRLAPFFGFFGERQMLSVWGDPLAKAWLVLRPLVEEERKATCWTTKWEPFEKMGTKALSKRPDLQAKLEKTTPACK